ncbi:MAG TPA: sodium:solute symporter family protein [Sedimentisphaerales bacterium]|nr:sodium:solute symporter family protein [Sedimentisphaerales bacterium]
MPDSGYQQGAAIVTTLQQIDWFFIITFFVVSLIVGIAVSRRAGTSSSEFFLSGRVMPWWLLGVSMVATTFSTDTPNLVTDIVRQNGVSGNWVWWAFLLTGMLTVFVYARLWRRSGVTTDIEFYELRYSGKAAVFLRGFRAIYLGVFFNIVIMAATTLAAIKIGGVMLGLSPLQTVVIAAVVTVAYSALGGLRGVLITDFFQFIIAMFGAIMAAKISLEHQAVGGLKGLLSNANISGKLNLIPDFSDTNLLMSVFIIPLAVQWWSVWYPGAEPGGGGYLVQRMLAAKDEKNAVGATLLFNIAHYALRPWPWIIVALCSIVVFPNLESLKSAFPNVNPDIIRNDLAYPAMLTFLPHGLLGLVIASLIAAYMSTISTHLNWGSSYIVNDFYKRLINTRASERRLVLVGRVSTVLLMVGACALAPFLENAKKAFDLMLQIGAGTGLIFILRWFWWRINAASEITAMAVSFLVACYFEFAHTAMGLPELAGYQKLVIGVAVTTISWLTVTFVTKPAEDKTLLRFCRLVRVGGPGWKTVLLRAEAAGECVDGVEEKWDLPRGILCMVFGCVMVYSALFATGLWMYRAYGRATAMTVVMIVSTFLLIKFIRRKRQSNE